MTALEKELARTLRNLLLDIEDCAIPMWSRHGDTGITGALSEANHALAAAGETKVSLTIRDGEWFWKGNPTDGKPRQL